MAVRNILIEGVSGAGKTTVAEELERRGFHVVHGDRTLAYVGDPDTGAPATRPLGLAGTDLMSWSQAHHLWDVEQVESLIADRTRSVTFFCGGSRNWASFIERFDAVFVLDVDAATLDDRLRRRPLDEFGGGPGEREFVLGLHATRQDVPRTGITVDATAPVAEVVDAILAQCDLPTELGP